MNTSKIGRLAELRARQWLEAAGWVCLEENARSRFFELDLVMKEAGTIVFVEVKYRRSEAYGGGGGALSYDKGQRLLAGAQLWLAERDLWNQPVRFDVVLISRMRDESLALQHIRDCLSQDELW